MRYIATKELANNTPECPCGDYIVPDQQYNRIYGAVGAAEAWWVECPNCKRGLGEAHLPAESQNP